MKRIIYNWGPVLVLASGIYIISAFPQGIFIPSGLDKVIHFLEFALLGFFTARAILLSGNLGRWTGIGLAALIAALWGVLDEFHQSFGPGRQASLGDGIADALGALAGALSFAYLGLFLYRTEKLYPKKKCSDL